MYDKKYRIVLLDESNKLLYKAPLHSKIEYTLYLLFHCNTVTRIYINNFS